MRRRAAWAVGALALAAAALGLAWLWLPHRVASETAPRLLGERWYVVAFRHTPIGEYHTASGLTPGGHFEFTTALRFALAEGAELREDLRLVFDRGPPHRLREAQKVEQRGGAATRLVYRDGVATVTEGANRRQTAGRLDFRLADHLAVEHWLASTDAMPGDVHTARSLDLDRLRVAPVTWQLLKRDAERVAVAGAWPLNASVGAAATAASRLTLDGQQVPLHVAVDEVLTLQRVVDAEAAHAWRQQAPLFAAASRRIAVDRPIATPANLRALTVAIEGASEEASAWPATLAVDLDVPRRANAAEIAAATAATVRYPANDSQLKRLARTAVGDLEQPAEQARALARFVHGHLRYRDTTAARTVLDTVRERAGDCTEYADLFTTLARSLNVPARTVIGLAYRADEQTFALHAWNEVVIDDHWHGMDPTWDLPRLGAARLALPANTALAAIMELPRLRFRIVETRYVGDGRRASGQA